MAAREVEATVSFARSLKQLSKKHPELQNAVQNALDEYSNKGPTHRSDKIPNLDGQPVFKERLRLSNQGQSGGARIIYYCDSEQVIPLFLYVKSGQADVPAKEIRDALKAADLLGPHGDGDGVVCE